MLTGERGQWRRHENRPEDRELVDAARPRQVPARYENTKGKHRDPRDPGKDDVGPHCWRSIRRIWFYKQIQKYLLE